MMRAFERRWRVAAAVLMLLLALGLGVLALNHRGEDALQPDTAGSPGAAEVERGAYLARAGNCAACHTARGGDAYAGGRPIDTPFGTVYATNLTPDADTGLGRWTRGEFWRAMHNGRSRDGRLLYPAFPYPDYTRITRADSDALWAYLRTLPAVRQMNREHALRFPYGWQLSLAMWRALYFRPEQHVDDPARSVDWNRGAYLVQGLGHCAACHASRNWMGATQAPLELSGGLIPMQNWYAPSLAAADEAGVAHWSLDEIAQLLGTGVAPRGSVLGPMAEVVFRSTQYLTPEDLRAMAVYLQALPGADAAHRPVSAPQVAASAEIDALRAQGADIYTKRCADCHGKAGEGAGLAYPALAGNRAVTMQSPANLVRVVLSGGFLPATQGNPRPYGMPPYSHVLDNAEIAAVLTYIRSSWGHAAAPVTPLNVLQLREVPER